MLLCDQYLVPKTLAEAFSAMREHRGRSRVVAGCTDILPWAREGRAGDVEIPVLIDISKIPEMNERRISNERVHLGACTTLQSFLDDPALARALPAMPRCAIWFADDQIRAQATIGGNIANASPAADANPALIAHNASVELARMDGSSMLRRQMPLSEFLKGPGKTDLADDELIVSVACDAMPGYGGSFEKVGHRRSLVISVACLATLMKLSDDGRVIEDVRFGLAGVCAVPCRLGAVETFLKNKLLSLPLLEEASAMPLDLVQSRTRREYRKDILQAFMMRGLITAAKRAGADHAILTREMEAEYV
jgi:carbon-monoxide dehydrogenase medium subunit/xanthine dehydrogenase FAD-binding subunit